MSTTWTTEQQKVIDLRDRNILVSAAAGSGKTAVLVERIITMITDPAHPVDIDELLVVTFTRAAAAEMKERIGKALHKQMEADPENENLEKQIALLGSAQITTIDSFCLHILRDYFTEIDLDPSMRVADESELKLLKADTMEELLEDMYASGNEDFLNFVECYARGKNDASLEEKILQLYEFSRSAPWPKQWLESCVEALDIKDKKSLSESKFMKILLDYMKHLARDFKEQLVMAKQICRRPDGPDSYEVPIDVYIQFVDDMISASDFEVMGILFADLPKLRFTKIKNKDCTEEHKNLVTAIRDRVKKSLDKFKKDIFYTDLDHMVSDILLTKKPMQMLIQLVIEFSDRFQALKAEKSVMDFSDVEHFALEILVGTDDEGHVIKRRAALELSEKFKEILCDEYQDSNMVQELLLTSVSTVEDGKPNMFMVGDVKQSIYRFRLARPELFMEKYDTYSLEDSDFQRIDLFKNFRSRKCVVDFVNLIFEHIMGKQLGDIEYDKYAALYLGADYPDTEALVGKDTEVLLLTPPAGDEEPVEGEENVSDREYEARMVAGRIQALIASGYQVYDRSLESYRRIEYRDIAILLRSVKEWAEPFVGTLADMGIPANAQSSAGFFDTYEIQTAVALLSVIDNPLQDIELAMVMKSCIGGFSDEDLAMIRSAKKKGAFFMACQAFMAEGAEIILDQYYDRRAWMNLRERLRGFLEMLENFRNQASFMSIHELILYVFEKTDYDYLITAMSGGRQRHANLELFIEKAVAYERTSYRGLFNFVRYISHLKKQDTDIGEVPVFGEHENVVRIVSIHKSKGLEYPVVFVCGMSKKFNTQDTNKSILVHTDYGLGTEAVDAVSRVVSPTIFKKALATKIKLENLSEELRVLYVALTRAREKLILTGSVKNPENQKMAWEKAALTAGRQLLYDDLVNVSCYFDWVMPVLLNENYRSASEAKVDIQYLTQRDMIWQQAETILSNREKEGKLMQQAKAFDLPVAADEVAKHLSWLYPDQEVVFMPSKLSISEIKKMAQSEDVLAAWEGNAYVEERLVEGPVQDDICEVQDEAQEEKEEKPDLQTRMEAAAARGTAVHKLMELADFTALRCLDDVKAFMEQCKEKGMIAEDILDQINPWKIFNMVRSSLGKRMAAAQKADKLYREAQFVMAVDARDVYKDQLRPDQEEIILTQGIIDIFFEEEDGLVLMDYKTDYVAKGQEEELVKRYKVQLDYYQQAIEAMTHKKVKEKLIYAFSIEDVIVVD